MIVSSEIARGLDIFELTPSAFISQNEIDAAKTVHLDYLNTQGQPKFVWPPSFALARAYVDQLERSKGLAPAGSRRCAVRSRRAEKASGCGAPATRSRSWRRSSDGDASGSSDCGEGAEARRVGEGACGGGVARSSWE